MANQRMYIRCQSCGAEKFLAKRLLGAFHVVDHGDWGATWDEWYEKHEWGLCGNDAEGLDIFELVYESKMNA